MDFDPNKPGPSSKKQNVMCKTCKTTKIKCCLCYNSERQLKYRDRHEICQPCSNSFDYFLQEELEGKKYTAKDCPRFSCGQSKTYYYQKVSGPKCAFHLLHFGKELGLHKAAVARWRKNELAEERRKAKKVEEAKKAHEMNGNHQNEAQEFDTNIPGRSSRPDLVPSTPASSQDIVASSTRPEGHPVKPTPDAGGKQNGHDQPQSEILVDPSIPGPSTCPDPVPSTPPTRQDTVAPMSSTRPEHPMKLIPDVRRKQNGHNQSQNGILLDPSLPDPSFDPLPSTSVTRQDTVTSTTRPERQPAKLTPDARRKQNGHNQSQREILVNHSIPRPSTRPDPVRSMTERTVPSKLARPGQHPNAKKQDVETRDSRYQNRTQILFPSHAGPSSRPDSVPSTSVTRNIPNSSGPAARPRYFAGHPQNGHQPINPIPVIDLEPGIPLPFGVPCPPIRPPGPSRTTRQEFPLPSQKGDNTKRKIVENRANRRAEPVRQAESAPQEMAPDAEQPENRRQKVRFVIEERKQLTVHTNLPRPAFKVCEKNPIAKNATYPELEPRMKRTMGIGTISSAGSSKEPSRFHEQEAPTTSGQNGHHPTSTRIPAISQEGQQLPSVVNQPPPQVESVPGRLEDPAEPAVLVEGVDFLFPENGDLAEEMPSTDPPAPAPMPQSTATEEVQEVERPVPQPIQPVENRQSEEIPLKEPECSDRAQPQSSKPVPSTSSSTAEEEINRKRSPPPQSLCPSNRDRMSAAGHMAVRTPFDFMKHQIFSNIQREEERRRQEQRVENRGNLTNGSEVMPTRQARGPLYVETSPPLEGGSSSDVSSPRPQQDGQNLKEDNMTGPSTEPKPEQNMPVLARKEFIHQLEKSKDVGRDSVENQPGSSNPKPSRAGITAASMKRKVAPRPEKSAEKAPGDGRLGKNTMADESGPSGNVVEPTTKETDEMAPAGPKRRNERPSTIGSEENEAYKYCDLDHDYFVWSQRNGSNRQHPTGKHWQPKLGSSQAVTEDGQGNSDERLQEKKTSQANENGLSEEIRPVQEPLSEEGVQAPGPVMDQNGKEGSHQEPKEASVDDEGSKKGGSNSLPKEDLPGPAVEAISSIPEVRSQEDDSQRQPPVEDDADDELEDIVEEENAYDLQEAYLKSRQNSSEKEESSLSSPNSRIADEGENDHDIDETEKDRQQIQAEEMLTENSVPELSIHVELNIPQSEERLPVAEENELMSPRSPSEHCPSAPMLYSPSDSPIYCEGIYPPRQKPAEPVEEAVNQQQERDPSTPIPDTSQLITKSTRRQERTENSPWTSPPPAVNSESQPARCLPPLPRCPPSPVPSSSSSACILPARTEINSLSPGELEEKFEILRPGPSSHSDPANPLSRTAPRNQVNWHGNHDNDEVMQRALFDDIAANQHRSTPLDLDPHDNVIANAENMLEKETKPFDQEYFPYMSSDAVDPDIDVLDNDQGRIGSGQPTGQSQQHDLIFTSEAGTCSPATSSRMNPMAVERENQDNFVHVRQEQETRDEMEGQQSPVPLFQELPSIVEERIQAVVTEAESLARMAEAQIPEEVEREDNHRRSSSLVDSIDIVGSSLEPEDPIAAPSTDSLPVQEAEDMPQAFHDDVADALSIEAPSIADEYKMLEISDKAKEWALFLKFNMPSVCRKEVEPRRQPAEPPRRLPSVCNRTVTKELRLRQRWRAPVQERNQIPQVPEIVADQPQDADVQEENVQQADVQVRRTGEENQLEVGEDGGNLLVDPLERSRKRSADCDQVQPKGKRGRAEKLQMEEDMEVIEEIQVAGSSRREDVNRLVEILKYEDNEEGQDNREEAARGQGIVANQSTEESRQHDGNEDRAVEYEPGIIKILSGEEGRKRKRAAGHEEDPPSKKARKEERRQQNGEGNEEPPAEAETRIPRGYQNQEERNPEEPGPSEGHVQASNADLISLPEVQDQPGTSREEPREEEEVCLRCGLLPLYQRTKPHWKCQTQRCLQCRERFEECKCENPRRCQYMRRVFDNHANPPPINPTDGPSSVDGLANYFSFSLRRNDATSEPPPPIIGSLANLLINPPNGFQDFADFFLTVSDGNRQRPEERAFSFDGTFATWAEPFKKILDELIIRLGLYVKAINFFFGRDWKKETWIEECKKIMPNLLVILAMAAFDFTDRTIETKTAPYKKLIFEWQCDAGRKLSDEEQEKKEQISKLFTLLSYLSKEPTLYRHPTHFCLFFHYILFMGVRQPEEASRLLPHLLDKERLLCVTNIIEVYAEAVKHLLRLFFNWPE